MTKAGMLVLIALALGASSISSAQETQIKFSRVVDLTLPIESNMAPIPGLKPYLDNPSRVNVISSITEAQKEALRAEGMTLSSDHAVNGRSMISVLSILVHNGTHIDAPRHMMEKGMSVDRMPVSQFVKPGVLINLPDKGPNSVVTVKDVAESGVEIRRDTIVMINTGWTDKMWGKPGFWEQMPYLERGVAEFVANKGAAGLAIDVFPEKPLWRGVKLDPGEVWIANHLALMQKNLPLPVRDQPVADRQQPLHRGGRAARHQGGRREPGASHRAGGMIPARFQPSRTG
jgi:kynurenine formamidase